ncbi:FH protein interacting protein FIP2-like [Argentina anserina]|uniref:FH protein interacting protein FIP2-like n=1 Tax=Argentina anserina TaxID=57926 RepID=UPI0021763B8F|nr:FH protein interacting protein FIP2-like [Potentilla anserina]
MKESDSARWVSLNVGGKKFCTTLDTLKRQPGSMLDVMFSGKFDLHEENGYVMIDRDDKLFSYVLNWLRTGNLPVLEARMYAQLAHEADYYQLPDMRNDIKETLLQLNANMSRRDVLSGPFNVKLENPNFSDACLHRVNFSGAGLEYAVRSNCDCPNSIFDGASLNNSNMCCGNFSGSSFIDAKCQSADMTGANFTSTILTGANLTEANLSKANLTGADLRIANLTGANLTDADLTDANLHEATIQ